MKKIFLCCCLSFIGIATVSAQDMGQPQEEVLSPVETEMGAPDSDLDQSGREHIEEAELPAPVSEALATGEFSSMEISEAYRVKDESSETGAEIFEIHLETDNGLSTIVYFNEEGQMKDL